MNEYFLKGFMDKIATIDKLALTPDELLRGVQRGIKTRTQGGKSIASFASWDKLQDVMNSVAKKRGLSDYGQLFPGYSKFDSLTGKTRGIMKDIISEAKMRYVKGLTR